MQCEADRERKCQSEQLLVVPSTHRVANQQRITARRALEWISVEAQLVFRYEISYLFASIS